MTFFPRILPYRARAARPALRYTGDMAPGPEPARCPLCGEPNFCAMAGAAPGEPLPECWCRAGPFPPELLASVPERSRRQACICQSCLQRAGEAAQAAPAKA